MTSRIKYVGVFNNLLSNYLNCFNWRALWSNVNLKCRHDQSDGVPTTLNWNKLFTNVVIGHTSTLFPLYITRLHMFCYSHNHGDKICWKESAYCKDHAWAVSLIKTPAIERFKLNTYCHGEDVILLLTLGCSATIRYDSMLYCLRYESRSCPRPSSTS